MLTYLLTGLLFMTADIPAPVEGLTATDRARQAAAVEALAATDQYDADLIALWNETNRFDVRAHIVQALATRGEDGLPTLIELTRTTAARNIYGPREMLLRALVELGDASIDALVDDVKNHRLGNASLLAVLVERLESDPSMVANQVLRSKTRSARVGVLRHLVPMLPQADQAQIQVRLARNRNEQVRHEAISHRVTNEFVTWTDENRRAEPKAYTQFIKELRDLLGSDDSRIVHAAIKSLAANDEITPDDLITFEVLWLDRETEFWTRAEAMKAYAMHATSTSKAVETLIAHIDDYPGEVCMALAEVDPEYHSDAAIGAIVRVLPRAYPEEEYDDWDLHRPMWQERTRVSLDLRALPHLVDAVRHGDDAQARAAADAIQSLGLDAADAVPVLADRYWKQNNTIAKSNYAGALIAIAPTDERVILAVHDLITNIGDGERDEYFAGKILSHFIECCYSEERVREFAQQVLSVPDHPLHRYAMWSPPHDVSVYIEKNLDQYMARLRETPARDAAWAFVEGTGPEPDGITAYLSERDARESSARILKLVDTPNEEVIDVMIDVLTDPIFALPRPTRLGVHSQEDRRPYTRDTVLHCEYGVKSVVEQTLAVLLHRHPQHIPAVIHDLQDHPRLLAYLLSAVDWEALSSPDSHLLGIPDDLDPASRRIALDALRTVEDDTNFPHAGSRKYMEARGQYGCFDESTHACLVQCVQFGEGVDVPRDALAAIGYLKPMTTELLALIEEHFDDPRIMMQYAAYQAAGRAGTDALPLLDSMLEFGRSRLGYATSADVAQAVERIAPDDPRVVRYLEEYRTYLDRRADG
jgi:hypothetical protein